MAEALRPFAAGADLRGLFQATGTWALPPAEAAATPDPAGLDTVSGGRRDRPARGRRRFLIPAVVGVVGLAILAAVVLWPRAKPATASELRVNHARNGTSLGEMRLALDRVRVNDRVSVAADLSARTYYYLIAFNPDGSEQLCLPADPADQGDSGARPDKLPEVRYPRGHHDFELDAPGLQVFVLVVSARPLPPYAEWRSGCERIPWTAVPNGGNSSWHFDGEEFTRFRAEERGKIVPRDGAPAAVRDLCAFFKGREEFDAVRVFAFPVENGR